MRRNDDFERRLARWRPEPRERFLDRLETRARRAGDAARGTRLRLGFAGGLTAAVVVALASVGGLGYAATVAQKAADGVRKVVAPAKQEKVQRVAVVSGINAGGDQYRPGFGFGDENHAHTGPPGLSRGGQSGGNGNGNRGNGNGNRGNGNGNQGGGNGNQGGGAFTPPVQPQPTKDGKALLLPISFTLDEQAALRMWVVDSQGRRILLTQNGTSVGGQKLTGRQAKLLRYTVLVPRTINLSLRIPKNLVKPGETYRFVVQATDPEGNKSKLEVPFAQAS